MIKNISIFLSVVYIYFYGNRNKVNKNSNDKK